jgi:hypothetical protein
MKSIKRNNANKRRKLAIMIPLGIVVLVGGALTAAYATQTWPFNKQSESRDEALVDTKEEYNKGDDQNMNTEEASTDTPNGQSAQPTPAEDKTVQTANPVDQSTTPEVPNITRAEQSGSSIRISAIFNSASNGKCILSLEKAGQASVVKEAPIIVGPSYYTCSGFQVPRAELAVNGQWSAIILHDINGKRSASERRIINVQ